MRMERRRFQNLSPIVYNCYLKRIRVQSVRDLQSLIHGMKICISFVPDPYKVGGRYDTVTAPVRRLLDQEFALQLEDGREIHIDDIIDLQGGIFEGLKF